MPAGSSASTPAFGAGRILGLDARLETDDLGGETFLERYPRLEYLLG